MRILKRTLLICCCLVLSYLSVKSQVKNDSVRIVLDSLSRSDIPQLNDTINLSLTNISVSELLRSVSNHIGININVDPIETIVHNNYSKIRTKDLILLLCTEYNLKMNVYGSIISLKSIPESKYSLRVNYNANGKVSFDVKDAPLSEFAKELVKKSDVNIFVPPQFKSYRIDGFVKELSVEEALSNLAKANNFVFFKETEKLYVVEPLLGNKESNSKRIKKSNDVEFVGNGFVIKKKKAAISDLILDVADKTNSFVSFAEKIEDKKDVSIRFTDFKGFLNVLLTGTKYTYKVQDSIYHIGLKSKKEMHSHFLYKFNNRRVDSLSVLLPLGLVESMEVVEYPGINSLLLSGEISQLLYLKRICKQLDQLIPLVLIDVIMIESKDNLDISTGITAGLTKSGDEVPTTGGTISPGVDFTLNGSAINKVISRAGLSNLGAVNSSFYLQLKALEKTGILEIKSTPKLSTLSGRKASLSIGETVYYEENILSLFGSQNPGQQQQTIFKPIDARLGVDIKPVVTGNGYVNLEISVIQSSFTERVGASGTGPPGIVSREFKSMIRVKNGETILLGGLETVRKEKSRSGFPLLSKIPILNLLFTSKSKKKDDDKFSILISPKIIY